ncbi:hypothetical protein WISP_148730 [Willisornis vidua]|uniref:Uncharacterized protein n=1 Tax=Willisornis vidua TaxID=1566151 RepID=A0ABQ9CK79_9PASS|nr:hypothetical protein WISP_148730 [Willisornis vidua]
MKMFLVVLNVEEDGVGGKRDKEEVLVPHVKTDKMGWEKKSPKKDEVKEVVHMRRCITMNSPKSLTLETRKGRFFLCTETFQGREERKAVNFVGDLLLVLTIGNGPGLTYQGWSKCPMEPG